MQDIYFGFRALGKEGYISALRPDLVNLSYIDEGVEVNRRKHRHIIRMII